MRLVTGRPPLLDFDGDHRNTYLPFRVGMRIQQIEVQGRTRKSARRAANGKGLMLAAIVGSSDEYFS